MLRTRVFSSPSESELMEACRESLRRRERVCPTPLQTAPNTEFQIYLAHKEARRKRSLQRCHHYSLRERPRHASPKESGAFVPATAARIDDDRNLTDGARRCARKIMELTYRANRQGRALDVTVSYLGKVLGKCRRTVQRYLRLLEREGYIQVMVVVARRSRMCRGLVIDLLAPLFPRHERNKWPETRGNPGAAPESQNHRFRFNMKERGRAVPAEQWALRCMDGVFRALLRTMPPPPGF